MYIYIFIYIHIIYDIYIIFIHIHQFILLQSCDYLKKISIKIIVATEEDNSRNEI